MIHLQVCWMDEVLVKCGQEFAVPLLNIPCFQEILLQKKLLHNSIGTMSQMLTSLQFGKHLENLSTF